MSKLLDLTRLAILEIFCEFANTAESKASKIDNSEKLEHIAAIAANLVGDLTNISLPTAAPRSETTIVSTVRSGGWARTAVLSFSASLHQVIQNHEQKTASPDKQTQQPLESMFAGVTAELCRSAVEAIFSAATLTARRILDDKKEALILNAGSRSHPGSTTRAKQEYQTALSAL